MRNYLNFAQKTVIRYLKWTDLKYIHFICIMLIKNYFKDPWIVRYLCNWVAKIWVELSQPYLTSSYLYKSFVKTDKFRIVIVHKWRHPILDGFLPTCHIVIIKSRHIIIDLLFHFTPWRHFLTTPRISQFTFGTP